jgi:NTE family protein
MALTVSLGYSGKEIEELITNTNFKKFNDGRFLLPGGINRMNNYFGWYRGKRIESWLEEIIERKTGNPDITFEELHQKGLKDLYVTGTCLNKQQLVVFSYETYPGMKIKDAVRISMSIPFYFEAVFINKDGKVIHHPKEKKELDIMVDGGFTGNFPIRIFDTINTRSATLGFRIDSDEQIKNDRGEKSLAIMPVGSFKQYVHAFYNIVIENLNRQQLTEDDWKRTVSISDGNIGPRIRKLSRKEIEILIKNGRQGMKNYLN